MIKKSGTSFGREFLADSECLLDMNYKQENKKIVMLMFMVRHV